MLSRRSEQNTIIGYSIPPTGPLTLMAVGYGYRYHREWCMIVCRPISAACDQSGRATGG